MLRKLLPGLLLLGILLLIFTLTQCVPANKEILTDVNLDFKDPVYRQLYGYQDQLLTDSILPFFHDRDPSYRYAAALAFASNKDPLVVDSLIQLLDDEVQEVKVAAAYALGQIGSEKSGPALVKAFASDTLATSQKFKKIALESIGKSASGEYLDNISSVKSYFRSDTMLLEGQAYAIYRYGQRGITSPIGTQRMVDLLAKKGYPESVRLIAANYLYRTRDIQIDTFAGKFYQAAQRENNPQILQALAIAIGKTKKPVGLEALKYLYGKSDDFRVRVNVIRAMGNYDYLEVKDLIFNALKSNNQHIAQAASQFFVDYGTAKEGTLYFSTAKNTESLSWQVRNNLLRAANRHVPVYFVNTINNINGEIKARFEAPSDNVYEKAGLLIALSEYGWNYKYIYQKGYQSEQTIIRSASVDALAEIAMKPDFDKYFGGSARRVKKALAGYFQEAIEKGDIAMIAYAAKVLRMPSLNFKVVVDSIDFMTTAMSNLELPKEIEIKYELQKTVDYFNNVTAPTNLPPRYNHPIDWDLIEGINPDAEANIFTSKGEITLSLMLQHAPGTVANFVRLARNNFFDNKNFHRVISNFVVQGGCPRGDGYGGLDYTIRSELGMTYYDDAGYVGMASAGNHTECTQWFITHTPTPHLDGNYTIFAKVKSGMDVVNQLQIGDRITDIKIQN